MSSPSDRSVEREQLRRVFEQNARRLIRDGLRDADEVDAERVLRSIWDQYAKEIPYLATAYGDLREELRTYIGAEIARQMSAPTQP